MKTYCDNNKRYWFDTNLRLWTVLNINQDGYQVGETEYFNNRTELLYFNPQLKFIVELS